MQSPFPLSVSLAGLVAGAGAEPLSVRAALHSLAGMGWRCIQLDGAAPGTRARDLDRSARRDLAATFRRLSVEFSGLDLWIPPAHFTDAANSDRAVSAIEAGVAFVSELAQLIGGTVSGGRVLSCALPEACPGGILSHLASACEAHGVVLADHAWPARRRAASIGLGIDPAAIIFSGEDPVVAVSSLREPPAAARLCDLAAAGRVEVGSGLGRLDRRLYEAALHVSGYRGKLVADLRGLPEPFAAAERLLDPSDGAGPSSLT